MTMVSLRQCKNCKGDIYHDGNTWRHEPVDECQFCKQDIVPEEVYWLHVNPERIADPRVCFIDSDEWDERLVECTAVPACEAEPA